MATSRRGVSRWRRADNTPITANSAIDLLRRRKRAEARSAPLEEVTGGVFGEQEGRVTARHVPVLDGATEPRAQNQVLAIPVDVAKTFEERLVRLCGYKLFLGIMGHVDGASPGEALGIEAAQETAYQSYKEQ